MTTDHVRAAQLSAICEATRCTLAPLRGFLGLFEPELQQGLWVGAPNHGASLTVGADARWSQSHSRMEALALSIIEGPHPHLPTLERASQACEDGAHIAVRLEGDALTAVEVRLDCSLSGTQALGTLEDGVRPAALERTAYLLRQLDIQQVGGLELSLGEQTGIRLWCPLTLTSESRAAWFSRHDQVVEWLGATNRLRTVVDSVLKGLTTDREPASITVAIDLTPNAMVPAVTTVFHQVPAQLGMTVLTLGEPGRVGERVGAVAGSLQSRTGTIHRLELTTGPSEPPPVRFAFFGE